MHSVIEVHSENLQHNLDSFRKYVGPKTKIILVVKANAYGHGMKEVVTTLEETADAFAVDNIYELHAIRFYTNKDVYVLGHVSTEDMDTLIDLNGIPVVYDTDYLRKLDKQASLAGAQVQVNIKIDALLGRQGVLIDELKQLLGELRDCTNLSLRGVYAHFANIEDTADLTHAQKQLSLYKDALEIVHAEGFENFETHMSSTAGICAFSPSEQSFSHVRLGLGLYGLWPSPEIQKKCEAAVPLKPCLRWITSVAQVKLLPSDHPIGYGLTYVTSEPTRVAIIPQGYSDGYDRKLSNKGQVLVGGARCPVLGRVAMNMFAVNVSHIEDVRAGDEVVLLGKQGDEEIRAEEMAGLSDTISYEVISRLNPLIPREVV